MNLYLICHGMMLFWYRKDAGNGTDGYRILIPKSPTDDTGNRLHELRLGTSIGAMDTFLSYPDDPNTKTQFYTLSFGNRNSLKTRRMKSGADHLTFYSNGASQAKLNLDNIAFAIDIPYPTAEESTRYEHFFYNNPGSGSVPPYNNGIAVSAFGIKPTRLAMTNIFMFEIEDTDKDVVLVGEGEASSIQEVTEGVDVKLYLYSEEQTFDQYKKNGDHLGSLNDMLTINHNGVDKPCDLQLGGCKASCTPLEQVTPPFGLDSADLQHLVELYTGKGLCDLNSERQTQVGAAFIDPAECAQGHGC